MVKRLDNIPFDGLFGDPQTFGDFGMGEAIHAIEQKGVPTQPWKFGQDHPETFQSQRAVGHRLGVGTSRAVAQID